MVVTIVEIYVLVDTNYYDVYGKSFEKIKIQIQKKTKVHNSAHITRPS